MNAVAAVLNARLALALACLAALDDCDAEPVTYGRRAGDRPGEFETASHVHFGYVDFLAETADARDEHGLDINERMFNGKAA